jgi:hypothetical protein
MKSNQVRDLGGRNLQRSKCPHYCILKLRSGEQVYCTPAYYKMYLQMSGPMFTGWITLNVLMQPEHPLYQIALDITNTLTKETTDERKE